MRGTVNGDLSVFNGVKLRLPDIGFDTIWSVDLGDRIVEMHWFGAGMSPHDSLRVCPSARPNLNDITAENFAANAIIDPKYAIEPTLERLMTGFHRWNLQAAYSESKSQQTRYTNASD